jgi:hypothetical protein
MSGKAHKWGASRVPNLEAHQSNFVSSFVWKICDHPVSSILFVKETDNLTTLWCISHLMNENLDGILGGTNVKWVIA